MARTRAWMQRFGHPDNGEHRHSGIRLVTPHQRHQGPDRLTLAQRQAVYERAKRRHPARWTGPTRNWQPLAEVWLNPSAAVINRLVANEPQAQ